MARCLGCDKTLASSIHRRFPYEPRHIAIQRQTADNGGAANTLYSLGGLALLLGDTDSAQTHLSESLALFQAMGDKAFISHPIEMLGRIMLIQGSPSGARAQFRASLNGLQSTGRTACIPHALEAFARLALAQRQPNVAAQLLGAATALSEATGVALLPVEQALFEQTHEAVRHSLLADEFSLAWQAEHRMSLTQAIAFAFEARASG